MRALARALLLLAVGAWALLLVLEPEGGPREEPRAPLLPAEAAVLGSGSFCAQDLPRALAADAFRWVSPAGRRIWRRGLTVLCDAGDPETAKLAVLAGKAPVWRATVARRPGEEGDALTAAVAARLLWEQPAVAAAAERAFLDNQADVARAGADLWRARRWPQAADALFAALENDWAQPTDAQLYYGLAQSEAHLGHPRQAFWFALAYTALSQKQPPEDWLRSLRGVSDLLAEQPATVEPRVQELARRRARRQADGDLRGAFDDLKSLCSLAPWAEDYQLETASVYDRLGWRALANSWKRRAALTRRLLSDSALQARLSQLTR